MPRPLGHERRQPDLIFQRAVVRRKPHMPHPLQNRGRHQPEKWGVVAAFDLLQHPLQGKAGERRSLDAVDPRAKPLHIGKHARRIRLAGRMGHEPRQIRRGGQVVLLPEAEKIAVATIHQPVEISRPAELPLLHIHLEPRIAKKGNARLRGDLIIAIDRNTDLEIRMVLPLDRPQRFLNKFLALVDRHRDENLLAGACRPPLGRRQGEPLAGTIPLPGDQALLERRSIAPPRWSGSRFGLRPCKAAEFVQKRHTFRAGRGQKGRMVGIGVAEQRWMDRGPGTIERDV